MISKTWIFRDRTKWEKGEWDKEPDKVQWEDPDTKFPCLALRNLIGNWCGYVGVPKDHPFYGKNYDECSLKDSPCEEDYCDHCSGSILNVHGGITFNSFCNEGNPIEGICHQDPEKVWWIGFDTAHCDDLSPGGFSFKGTIYRSLSYVMLECLSLASQLEKLNGNSPRS